MPTEIYKHEVRRLIEDEDASPVEVLPREEYAEAHLAGAINIPLKELDRDAVSDLDNEGAVIVYCHDYL